MISWHSPRSSPKRIPESWSFSVSSIFHIGYCCGDSRCVSAIQCKGNQQQQTKLMSSCGQHVPRRRSVTTEVRFRQKSDKTVEAIHSSQRPSHLTRRSAKKRVRGKIGKKVSTRHLDRTSLIIRKLPGSLSSGMAKYCSSRVLS